jgi:hypothetical protein
MPQTGTATARLSAHGGAQVIDRQGLALIQTPHRTTSFTPIPHIEFVETLEKQLKMRSLTVVSEQFAVQSDGMKLYGTLVLQHQTREDFNFAIGLRTSNDKTLAAQLIVGVHIFVCDNGAFSGEPITWRKHTALINLDREVGNGLDIAVKRFTVFDSRVADLKAAPVTLIEAKAMIVDAAMQGVMPKTMITDVVRTYMDPPHEEFREPNLWSLHNAFTQEFKNLRPNVALESAIELGKMFAL